MFGFISVTFTCTSFPFEKFGKLRKSKGYIFELRVIPFRTSFWYFGHEFAKKIQGRTTYGLDKKQSM